MKQPKTRFSPKRELFIPEGAQPVKDAQSSAIVYTYENPKMHGWFNAIAFKPKAKRATWIKVFRSPDLRADHIEQWFKSLPAKPRANEDAQPDPTPPQVTGWNVADIVTSEPRQAPQDPHYGRASDYPTPKRGFFAKIAHALCG